LGATYWPVEDAGAYANIKFAHKTGVIRRK